MPSDMAILESGEPRKDLPCTVTVQKPQLGFDLRFHTGYEVTVPFRELAGGEEFLTVLFRVYPEKDRFHAAYFVEHFRVPAIRDDAKGDAILPGSIDIGEGNYHVDWLMRDRAERICSSSWDVDAELPPKDKVIPLFIKPKQIAETPAEPFVNDVAGRQHQADGDGQLRVKLLVNFSPQNADASSLQRSDTDALVTILKAIERNPHVGHISLIAFNVGQERVVYREQTATNIDFQALGKALETMKLGTVNVQQLTEKHSETDFLAQLIQKEVGNSNHPDAVIFAGPKAMLDADVPEEGLRRIGDIECPVFYVNYNLNPQAIPWKDSISHAIRAFKGMEYTISQPRDVWFSTSDMLSRILRLKKERATITASAGGTR